MGKVTLTKLTKKRLLYVGAIVLLVAIYYYSKGKLSFGMTNQNISPDLPEDSNANVPNDQNTTSVAPSDTLGTTDSYAAVKGIQTDTQGLPSSCTQQDVADPSELLPSDQNSQWAGLNPTGTGDLQNVNLLQAGYHIGIDTIGQSLRNANQQIRSEPPNPQLNVGPWSNTTISPDLMRRPLEVGQGPQ